MSKKSPQEVLRQAKENQGRTMVFSREKILVATLRLAEKGVRLSLRKIATEAGCAPPSIYYHFKNKHAIMIALFERLFVSDGGIDALKMNEYFKKNITVFRAMFSSEKNINIIDWVSTGSVESYATIIGSLIILDAANDKK